jgi:hypothetical protein
MFDRPVLSPSDALRINSVEGLKPNGAAILAIETGNKDGR